MKSNKTMQHDKYGNLIGGPSKFSSVLMKYGVGNQHYISAQEISTMNGSPSPQ
jgi:hypothetical protein